MTLGLLQDLVCHKGYANASLLRAVRNHPQAGGDQDLREMLHHILIANRFWFLTIMDRPFAADEEATLPDSMNALGALYRDTQAEEMEWILHAREADLTQTIETPYIPGGRFTVAEAVTQVCLHSHGHRAQCATRLRLLGGDPPTMDFIVWLKERPAADWS